MVWIGIVLAVLAAWGFALTLTKSAQRGDLMAAAWTKEAYTERSEQEILDSLEFTELYDQDDEV